MDEKLLQSIREFDFYSGDSKSFHRKIKNHEAVLVQGRHWEKSPEVTILIPTFKRRDLLKQALDSALAQEQVKDYQVIVADNEGIPCNIDTDTSKLIQTYHDDRLIYYRYDRQVAKRLDSIVALARSKWICFLHDDDVLAPNYLVTMLKIVRRHKNISFLACNLMHFTGEISVEYMQQYCTAKERMVSIKKDIRKGYYFYAERANWLGAFINRNHYIQMGGMPDRQVIIGDHIMVGNYNDRYGVYRITSGPILYFRRQFEGQLTAKGAEMWTDCYINEMLFYQYLANKTLLFRKIFMYRGMRIIRDNTILFANGFYDIRISYDEIMKRCGVEELTWIQRIRCCYMDAIISEFMKWYIRHQKVLCVEV